MKYDGTKSCKCLFFLAFFSFFSADDLICTGKAGLPLKGYLPHSFFSLSLSLPTSLLLSSFDCTVTFIGVPPAGSHV